jgi:hypothetical protein
VRGSWKALALAALTLVLVALLPGCGSGGSLPVTGQADSAPASVKAVTLHDRPLGFSVAYPFGWRVSQWRAPAGPRKTGDLLLSMAFVDPKGTVVNGKYVDGEQLSVFQLDRAIKPGVKYPDTARRIVMGSLLSKLGTVDVRRPLHQISINGHPAWQIGYTYSMGGHTVFADSALVLKRSYAYWLTGQSESHTWRTTWPVLSLVMGAFKVT